jgi:adenylate kinase family enzyme
MKIFVIGASGTGKTTACKEAAAKRYGKVVHLRASEWVRHAVTPQQVEESDEHYRQRLTSQSTVLLGINPDACIDTLHCAMAVEGKSRIFLIDGIRNPRDFARLYNKGDYVILVDSENYATPFEAEGVPVIKSIVAWMKDFMGFRPIVTVQQFQILPAIEAILESV